MTPSTVYLYRIQPDRNCYRYYELSLQPGLFQEWSLRRSWGRIGTKGRDKTVWFASREKAEQFCERKRREKLRRGYLPALFPIAPSSPIHTQGRQATERERLTPAKKPTRAQRASEGQQELFRLCDMRNLIAVCT